MTGHRIIEILKTVTVWTIGLFFIANAMAVMVVLGTKAAGFWFRLLY